MGSGKFREHGLTAVKSFSSCPFWATVSGGGGNAVKHPCAFFCTAYASGADGGSHAGWKIGTQIKFNVMFELGYASSSTISFGTLRV